MPDRNTTERYSIEEIKPEMKKIAINSMFL